MYDSNLLRQVILDLVFLLTFKVESFNKNDFKCFYILFMFVNYFLKSYYFIITKFFNFLQIYQDGKSQQLALDQQEKSLEQTKKKFEKEWKECERAHANFEKLDSDINVTKIEVEKVKASIQF